jgi:hypothetical protein
MSLTAKLSLSFLAVTIVLVSGFRARPASAIAIPPFDPGNIMSNGVMANKGTMSETDINTWLHSKNPCNDTNLSRLTGYNATTGYLTYGGKTYNYDLSNGHFVCMADENFNGESAAHIIWQASQDYNVNPQVLLVLLQKEQGLVTDTWPNTNYQYPNATGYGCTDTGGGCTGVNAGFKLQIRKAANLFHEVLDNTDYDGDGLITDYPVGQNYVQYNPVTKCGGTVVNIQNRATSALYRYTPYQPNAYALSGGSDSSYPNCGAFGNMNFYNYFNAWFGTSIYVLGTNVAPAYTSALGNPAGSEACGIKDNGCYQFFDNGSIYWSQATGAHIITGGIRAKWGSTGNEWGPLGLPTTNEQYGNKGGGANQSFENGRIYYTNTGVSYVILNPIIDRWNQSNAEWGTLGYPTMDTVCGLAAGGCYQLFQNSIVIYWSPSTGAHTVGGAIRAKWGSTGSEWGPLGYPISDEQYGNKGSGAAYQLFQNGRVYWTGSASYEILNPIIDRWNQSNAEWGTLGYPVTSTICGIANGGCYQIFQNNVEIYWSQVTGSHTIAGGIRAKWGSTGSEWGPLGLPTSDELYEANGAYQTFEHGAIHYPYNGTPASVVYNQ